MKTRTLDRTSRPWVQGKQFQGFLGTYWLHSCGLWFPVGCDKSKVERTVEIFSMLPVDLQTVATDYQLTVSFSPYQWTAANNSSTIYGELDNPSKVKASPHIEFGSRSYEHFFLPHFAHEISHLYWATRKSADRERYTNFLCRSMTAQDVEVTDYAQEQFHQYMRYISEEDTTRPPKFRVIVSARYRDDWVKESYCETVGRLVDPTYPDYDWASTVNLAARRSQIFDCTGLAA